MPAEFTTITWDDSTVAAARRLVKIALEEDLANEGDITTACLADPERQAAAAFVTRQQGVIAGLPILEVVADQAGFDVKVQLLCNDGTSVAPGDAVARMSGRAGDLLTCERTMLNFLGRLSGIASYTRRFVDLTKGAARVYDTRKTTPGWRRIEKYAVHCGGGFNHRMGLYDAVLIKDNHLAHAASSGAGPAEAVKMAKEAAKNKIIEVEVDSLAQLEQVLPVVPDLVLLDNMTPQQLTDAVQMRNRIAPDVQLEASGGVSLPTIGAIALTGVDRVSVGALTHSSGSLDIGLDWG